MEDKIQTLISTLETYLSYESADGNPKRRELRDCLKSQLGYKEFVCDKCKTSFWKPEADGTERCLCCKKPVSPIDESKEIL